MGSSLWSVNSGAPVPEARNPICMRINTSGGVWGRSGAEGPLLPHIDVDLALPGTVWRIRDLDASTTRPRALILDEISLQADRLAKPRGRSPTLAALLAVPDGCRLIVLDTNVLLHCLLFNEIAWQTPSWGQGSTVDLSAGRPVAPSTLAINYGNERCFSGERAVIQNEANNAGSRSVCEPKGQVLGRGVSRLVTGDPWGQAVRAWMVGSVVSSVVLVSGSLVAARVSRERFMMSMPR